MEKFRAKRKITVILIVGALLAYFMNMRMDITFSDALFVCGMVFFLVALMQLAFNLGVFGGAGYGFKSFYRFVRNKNDDAKELESGFAEHMASRPKHRDIVPLFLIGLGLCIIAVLFGG